jgi:hypothetical protein
MTIEEGTGDEFLLTCFVCKNPFGLVAQFCGYCQATRQQALGVERARPDQKVVSVTPTQPASVPQSEFIQPTPKQDKSVFLPPNPQKVAKPQIQRPIKQKSHFQENVKIRSKNIETWQKKNSKLVSTLGLFAFLLTTYFSTQSLIFASSSPATLATEHLQLGVSRDTQYFEGFSENTGVRFFPSQFASWDDSSAGNWITTTNWNGWRGNASVDFLAGGTGYSGIPVTAKFKAEYDSFLGVFRKIDWVLEAPATLELSYPGNRQLSIYINGLAAGTVGRPAVSEGTYQMYPGEFEIKFYDLSSGEEVTSLSRYFFIDAYGKYVIDLG